MRLPEGHKWRYGGPDAGEGFVVLSLRHNQTATAGSTVVRFFSCDLSQSKEAFDSEVALCKQDGRDYLSVYLMQAHPSRGAAMLEGAALLEKWEAQP